MTRLALARALLLLLGLVFGRPAHAAEAPLQHSATSSAATALSSHTFEDAGWRAFRDGLLDLAAGDRERARSTLEAMVRAHPEHPAVPLAIEVLAALGGHDHDEAGEPRTLPMGLGARTGLGARLRAETVTGLARAEVVSGQTVHGLATGIELCILAECDDARLAIATVMASAGAGLALSLVLTGDGITSGHAAAINAGTEWGAWNALALNVAVNDADDSKALMGSLIVGQLVGTGVGTLAWRLTGASSGDVSFSNTVGLWSGVLAALVSNIPDGTRSETMFGVSLAASDAGLIAGALLTQLVPMSRGRALLIDLTGGLGLLFGMGTDVLISGDDVKRETLMAAGAAGTAIGLGLGYYLTRTWDLPDAPDVRVGLVPEKGGGRAIAGFVW